MSSVIDRIKKRAFYPVKLVNGETVHVRGVKHKLLEEAKTFSDDEESVGYLLGVGLVEDSGELAFSRSSDESPKQFGARVLDALSEMGPDVRDQIVETIFKVSYKSETMRQEAIVKN